MPRPRNIIKPVSLMIWMPADLKARLDLHLYSESEGRVPYAAHTKFIQQLLREYFEKLEAKS